MASPILYEMTDEWWSVPSDTTPVISFEVTPNFKEMSFNDKIKFLHDNGVLSDDDMTLYKLTILGFNSERYDESIRPNM